jgi:GNAT superfamily N-acetyltransferase
MSKEAVSKWMGSFSRSGPHRLFVATESGRLLGLAGGQQYCNHPAFHKTIETSTYVDPDAVGRGVGSALYEKSFQRNLGRGSALRRRWDRPTKRSLHTFASESEVHGSRDVCRVRCQERSLCKFGLDAARALTSFSRSLDVGTRFRESCRAAEGCVLPMADRLCDAI